MILGMEELVPVNRGAPHISVATVLEALRDEIKRGPTEGLSLGDSERLTRDAIIERCHFLAKEARDAKYEDAAFAGLEKALAGHDERTRDLIYWMRGFDAVANRIQYIFGLRLILACVLAFVFLLAFELYAHCPGISGNPYVLAVGIVSLIVGFLLLRGWKRIVGSREIQISYLNVRLVAEALRIAVVWRANGIEENPFNCCPRRHWERIHIADVLVRRLCDPTPTTQEAHQKEEHREDRGNIRKSSVQEWVQDQLEFFFKKHHKHQAKGEAWEEIGKRAFGAGLLALVSLGILSFQYPMHEHHMEALVTFGPICIAIAAISEFYKEKSGFSSLAKRYEFGHRVFGLPQVEKTRESMSALPPKLLLSHDFHSILHKFGAKRHGLFWSDVLNVLTLTSLAALVWQGAHEVEGIMLWLPLVLTVACAVLTGISCQVWAKRIAKEADHRGDLIFKQPNGSFPERPPFAHEWRSWIVKLEEPPPVGMEFKEWRKNLRDFGDQAANELVDWYVSSIEREITIPK